jgi:hypothetical protein
VSNPYYSRYFHSQCGNNVRCRNSALNTRTSSNAIYDNWKEKRGGNFLAWDYFDGGDGISAAKNT